VVKAFVVVAGDAAAGDALAAELQAYVKARIAPYKYPRRIEFLEALPRTPTGKVQRTRLRAMDEAR
jgi:acyl-coenzyme A synthetase/AMP-(fatty) acid ligase